MPRDHGKLSVTIFWFRENSWEPTFISFNVQKHVVKHTLKLKNISAYYYLQKTSMSIIKCQTKVNLSVKCACTKASKTPDSSSIKLKKYPHLKCSQYRSCFLIQRFGPHHRFNSEIVTKRLYCNCC